MLTVSVAGNATGGLSSTAGTVSAQVANPTFSSNVTAPITITLQSHAAVTWATPAPITYGTALSSVQLNAVGNTAGSYSYNPPSGTVPGGGSQTLSVSFTPSNQVTYPGTATTTVTQVVNQASQTINFTPPTSPVIYGVSPVTLVATATSGLPVAFSVLSGPGSISNNSTLSFTAAGTVIVLANQAGNANYASANTVQENIVVNAAATTTTALSASSLTPTFGDSVVLTATITPTPTGSPWAA